MDYHIRHHREDGELLKEPEIYRRIIGRMLYLTQTRLDLCFAVNNLSQFVQNPTEIHLQGAKRVLRFVKNSPGKGLYFPATTECILRGFVDADWASCPDTRRSVTGFCFYLGSSLICWRSKKQPTVSKSSSESEYRALSSASSEAQWLYYLLQDFKIPPKRPIDLYCDNLSAIYIATNPVFHERTKHIDLDCHFTREKIQSGVIHLLPISNNTQVADLFTKALPPGPFGRHVSKLGLTDISFPA
jgi:hypothetical protein